MILSFNQKACSVEKDTETHIIFGTPRIFLFVFSIYFILSTRLVAQTIFDPEFKESLKHIQNYNWELARVSLENQLLENPNWHRARVELSQVYIEVGEPLLALEEIEKVLAFNALPINVRLNVEKLKADAEFLLVEKVETEEHLPFSNHKFKGYLTAGFGIDSNVSLNSSDFFLNDLALTEGVIILSSDGELFLRNDGDVFSIDGVLQTEFQESPRNEAEFESSFDEFRFQISHRYDHENENLIWSNTLSIIEQKNDEFSQFERRQLDINSGIDWSLSDSLMVGTNINHRLLKRGEQKQLTNTKLGISVAFLNRYGNWKIGSEVSHAEYEDFAFVEFGDFIDDGEFGIFDTLISTLDEFNSNTLNLSSQWSQAYFDDRLFILGRVEYLKTNTSDNFDHTALRYSAGAIFNSSPKWTWQLFMSALNVNFREARVFSDRFADAGKSLRLNVTYSLNHYWQFLIDLESSERTTDIFGGLESDKTIGKASIKFNF
jgi:hypothetical protein